MKYNPSDDLGKEPVFKKLGKSLIARNSIKSGQQIRGEDLDGKIVRPQVIPVRESNKVIGNYTKVNIKAGEYIEYDMLKE